MLVRLSFSYSHTHSPSLSQTHPFTHALFPLAERQHDTQCEENYHPWKEPYLLQKCPIFRHRDTRRVLSLSHARCVTLCCTFVHSVVACCCVYQCVVVRHLLSHAHSRSLDYPYSFSPLSLLHALSLVYPPYSLPYLSLYLSISRTHDTSIKEASIVPKSSGESVWKKHR